jgi:outer membrane protein assembly factor BamD
VIRNSLIILFFAAVSLFSCSEFQRVQKSGDLNEKLNAAFKYYEKKDYYKATLLFDEVVPLVTGKLEGEKALFYYANTFYYQKQYIMSAYHYRDFYETYPRSQYAEESMFMHAKSLYNDSPDHNLDQTNSFDALKAIQRFANKYPQSARMEEANKMTDELNAKIERKAYENAKLYYKLSEFNSANYQASVLTFQSFLLRYPASQYAEEMAFLKVDAQYNLARHSHHDKQRERYFDAIDFYHNFIDKYPTSKYKKAAEELYDDCLKKLEQIKS